MRSSVTNFKGVNSLDQLQHRLIESVTGAQDSNWFQTKRLHWWFATALLCQTVVAALVLDGHLLVVLRELLAANIESAHRHLIVAPAEVPLTPQLAVVVALFCRPTRYDGRKSRPGQAVGTKIAANGRVQ
jgi:hypothetical protein